MKKRSERRKHRTLAVVRRSQTLSPRHRPPSRGRYLYLQTQFAEDRFTQFQVIVVIDPPRHTPTHRQDRSQYTALQLAPSVISYPRSQSKSTTMPAHFPDQWMTAIPLNTTTNASNEDHKDNSSFSGHFRGNPGFCYSKGWWRLEVVSGDNWSYKTCKVPVKSPPPTNQHPVLPQAGSPTNSIKALKRK